MKTLVSTLHTSPSSLTSTIQTASASGASVLVNTPQHVTHTQPSLAKYGGLTKLAVYCELQLTQCCPGYSETVVWCSGAGSAETALSALSLDTPLPLGTRSRASCFCCPQITSTCSFVYQVSLQYEQSVFVKTLAPQCHEHCRSFV